ncbi:UNVERIFIED_CONTAM: hypothetical protein GTU68_066775 [Idotea baltica]|nr:hypothetical protein [Idotea baltica]
MLGDKLVVGLNSNTSVSKLKGEKRPIKDEAIRAEILASLTYVDAVIIFEEETPKELIEAIEIDVLVKGGDYKKADIVGSNFVENNGGKTVIVPLVEGISSSILIEQM